MYCSYLLVSPFNQWTRNPKVESLLAAEYFSSRLKGCKYCTISQAFPVTPPVHKVPDRFGAFPIEILISFSFGRDLYLPSMRLHVYAFLPGTQFDQWAKTLFNPSSTKPFGTHTFYQGRGGRTDPPAISETVAPMNVKFCRVLETPLKVSEMLKLFT